jgi:ABC-type dipeptide/oligopeptide/nickel transport system permease subunit
MLPPKYTTVTVLGLSVSREWTVAVNPWLMLPGLFVVITVLCFNFVGDGLRDSADPYA